jgi:hypothetical protein
MQWLTAKKEAYAEAPFRQGHRSITNSRCCALSVFQDDK